MTLDPTTDAASAARRLWDAVVVGAGPAGALAARELARRGVSVLLVDRATFPRYKVCGGCLNPRSLHVLERVGLGNLVQRLGAVPLTRFQVATNRRRAELLLPTGAGVSREAFDTALVQQAISTGVAFISGVAAALLPVKGDDQRRALQLHSRGSDQHVDARVVVAANGLSGGLSGKADSSQAWIPGSRIGAGVMIADRTAGYAPGTIYMACGVDGYVGQVVVEDGRIDMAAALDPVAVKHAGGMGQLVEAILTQAGHPLHPGLTDLPWKGTPRLTRQAPTLGGHRLFIVGDAAGYIEPFTGEGMAWAMAGAARLAPLAIQAIRHWDNDLLKRWQTIYRREVARRQVICRTTARVLRRPKLTNFLVGGLARAPWLAYPVVQMMYHD